MHKSILAYLKRRLKEVKRAPFSDYQRGAADELREAIEFVEEEEYVEDWDDA